MGDHWRGPVDSRSIEYLRLSVSVIDPSVTVYLTSGGNRWTVVRLHPRSQDRRTACHFSCTATLTNRSLIQILSVRHLLNMWCTTHVARCTMRRSITSLRTTCADDPSGVDTASTPSTTSVWKEHHGVIRKRRPHVDEHHSWCGACSEHRASGALDGYEFPVAVLTVSRPEIIAVQGKDLNKFVREAKLNNTDTSFLLQLLIGCTHRFFTVPTGTQSSVWRDEYSVRSNCSEWYLFHDQYSEMETLILFFSGNNRCE